MELRRNGVAVGAVILIAALIFISTVNSPVGGETGSTLAGNVGARDCSGLASPELDVCVMGSIEAIIAEEGIAGGLEFFRTYYSRMGECHQLAHLMGQASYEAYANGDTIRFGPETSFCGWGFWHGFATSFARTAGGDYRAAKKFCTDIDGFGVAGIDSCFHGIGIGLVPDPPQPRAWGNPVAVANRAADNCGIAKENRKDYMECLAGAFHGVFDYMRDDRYGLHFDTANPFLACQAQESTERKDACYSQMMPLATMLAQDNIEAYLNDFLDADPAWAAAKGPDLEPYVSLIAAMYPPFLKGRNAYSPRTFVAKCRQFPEQFQGFCIAGMVRGHFTTGSITDGEYRSARMLCDAPGLAGAEKTECRKAVVRAGYEFYAPEDAARICREIIGGADAFCTHIAAAERR
ncbi:MAG: hypothetical protein Q8R35_01945 [bacterium]|nr:hypothetical protein [bacterium]